MKKNAGKSLNLLEKTDFLIFPICYALLVVCVSIYAPKFGYEWVVSNYISKWYFELNNSLGGYLLTFFWAFLDAVVILSIYLIFQLLVREVLKFFSRPEGQK